MTFKRWKIGFIQIINNQRFIKFIDQLSVVSLKSDPRQSIKLLVKLRHQNFYRD